MRYLHLSACNEAATWIKLPDERVLIRSDDMTSQRSDTTPAIRAAERPVPTRALGAHTARRFFLLLSRHRHFEVRGGRSGRASQRYEDLCLAVAIARLQHLCLTDSTDPRAARSPVAKDSLLASVATDLARQAIAVEATRRGLSPAARSRAEGRARERFGAIVAAVTAEVRTDKIVSDPDAAADQLTARAAAGLVPASSEHVPAAKARSLRSPTLPHGLHGLGLELRAPGVRRGRASQPLGGFIYMEGGCSDRARRTGPNETYYLRTITGRIAPHHTWPLEAVI